MKGENVDIVGKLCTLLDKENDLFLEYEQATLAALDCPADDVEHYITLRGAKANEIDGLREEITAVCGQMPDAPVLLECTRASLPFDKVPAGYQPVFYAGQNLRSVINRITQSDQQVMQRLERLRDEALDGIKQNQNMPKIRKYLTDLTDVPHQPLRDSKV
ncbi:hypothetical protein LJC64_00640 [Ruminococcaceae bacterium OttesenSCG-928-A11]|nr:hypothetical protein [Ruminococcaceae bacterium OttesenSCG-928-A11]